MKNCICGNEPRLNSTLQNGIKFYFFGCEKCKVTSPWRMSVKTTAEEWDARIEHLTKNVQVKR